MWDPILGHECVDRKILTFFLDQNKLTNLPNLDWQLNWKDTLTATVSPASEAFASPFLTFCAAMLQHTSALQIHCLFSALLFVSFLAVIFLGINEDLNFDPQNKKKTKPKEKKKECLVRSFPSISTPKSFLFFFNYLSFKSEKVTYLDLIHQCSSG